MQDLDRNPAIARIPRAAQRPRLTLPRVTGAWFVMLGGVVGLMWCVTAALIGHDLNARLGMAPADQLERLPEIIEPRLVGAVNILYRRLGRRRRDTARDPLAA